MRWIRQLLLGAIFQECDWRNLDTRNLLNLWRPWFQEAIDLRQIHHVCCV